MDEHSGRLLSAARAAEMAAKAETPQQELKALMEVLAHKEEIQLGVFAAQLQGLPGSSREERLPLREGGDDIGRIESRIPKHIFFHLLQQKNFGADGLASDEGQRDLKKAYPAFFPKTVSGKTTVPVTASLGGTCRRKSGVIFGRGTLNLAN